MPWGTCQASYFLPAPTVNTSAAVAMTGLLPQQSPGSAAAQQTQPPRGAAQGLPVPELPFLPLQRQAPQQQRQQQFHPEHEQPQLRQQPQSGCYVASAGLEADAMWDAACHSVGEDDEKVFMQGAASAAAEDNVPTPRLGLLPSVGGFVSVDDAPEDTVATPRLGPMAAVEGIITAPTRGSIGHPDSCAAACKYAKKKRGCKDGADCSHCHLCVWHSHRPRFARGASERHAASEETTQPSHEATAASAPQAALQAAAQAAAASAAEA